MPPIVVYTNQPYQYQGPGSPGAYAQNPGVPGAYAQNPGVPGAYAQNYGAPAAYGPGVIQCQPQPLPPPHKYQ